MYRKSKNFVAILIISIMVMMIFSGCGTNKQEQNTASGAAVTTGSSAGTTELAPAKIPQVSKPTTIQFWNGWTGPDGELLKKLVDYYNANNKDNVTVKMDILQFSALTEKMNAALASNTAPELYLGFANNDFAEEGQLTPIDDIFEKTNLQKSDFIEGVFDQMYYKEHLYGIPFQLSSQYLFWNKDLFTAAGLDPETPPKTWEEMLTIGEKINDKAKNINGGGVSFDNTMCYAMMALSYGGKLIDGDKLENFRAVLTDPQYKEGNLKALTIMKEQIDRGNITTQSGPQNETSFLGGKTAMLIGGAWEVAGIKTNKLNAGISLLPAGPQGIKQPGFPVAMIVMKGTKGDELLAAYKFIEYWNDNLNNKYDQKAPVYQWSQAQGYQPYLKSVATDEALTSDPIFKITNSYVDHYAAFYPNGFYKFLALGNDVTNPLLQNTLTGKMSAEQALDESQKKLEEMIKEMQEK